MCIPIYHPDFCGILVLGIGLRHLHERFGVQLCISDGHEPAGFAGSVELVVVYCLRDVSVLGGNHGLPELIAAAVVVGLHLWKKQMLLSLTGGTVCYMLLAQMVFK